MCVITKYIKPDGTFDLHQALRDECPKQIGSPHFKRAEDYIDEVEELFSPRKLTAAAYTLTHAVNIARRTT